MQTRKMNTFTSIPQKWFTASVDDYRNEILNYSDPPTSDNAQRHRSVPNFNMNITKSRTMPYPLHSECYENSLPINRCSANILADCLKSSPLYRQQESERWGQAINCYQEMMNNRDQCCTSPPNSPVNLGTSHKFSTSGASSSTCASPPRDGDNTCTVNSLSGSLMGSFPSLTKVSSRNRSLHGTNPQSRGDSSLELEAIAAVHELSFAVETISVSEILPRTPDLIFVNVTTVEGHPYCLELTLKGWRITSLRHDCMQGDFTRLDLFTTYYDTLYDLMDELSPGYRNRFSEKLAQKLRMLQAGEESDLVAPAPSYATTPLMNRSNSSDSDTFERQKSVALSETKDDAVDFDNKSDNPS